MRCVSRMRRVIEIGFGAKWSGLFSSSKDIPRPMPRDHTEPGRKFLRIANPPPGLPGFDQRVLDGILGFFAVLENAIGDGEQRPAMGANDHFKCLAIALNGCPVNFALIGVHHVDLQPRRRRSAFRAKYSEEFW